MVFFFFQWWHLCQISHSTGVSLSNRLFCNQHAHPLCQAWSYRLRCAKEVSVWFKSRLKPWYISIPSNPNLYSNRIVMKIRWQTIASNVSIRTISPIATPLPKAYDCVAVYIAGRRTNLVVYDWRPKPPTKNLYIVCYNIYVCVSVCVCVII